jgi:hypothetical protein
VQVLKKAKSVKGSFSGVLIANKIDLVNQRVVSTHHGEEFAKHNGLGYFECSAVYFFLK